MFQRKVQISESELFLIRWYKDWSNLSIKLNTTEIGSFPDKAALEMGKWLPLPNGKTVLVRLVKNELEIWDGNNELVSGLKSGESDYFTTAWKGLIAYGILFIILSSTTIYFNDYDIGGGAFSLFSILGLIGLIYIALALWARKKQDKIAYYIAASINGLLCLMTPLFGGLLLTAVLGVLAYYLYKGIKARPLVASETQYFPNEDLLDDGI